MTSSDEPKLEESDELFCQKLYADNQPLHWNQVVDLLLKAFAEGRRRELDDRAALLEGYEKAIRERKEMRAEIFQREEVSRKKGIEEGAKGLAQRFKNSGEAKHDVVDRLLSIELKQQTGWENWEALEREERAAREAWEKVYNTLPHFWSQGVVNEKFEDWWKQRRAK